MTPHSVQVVSPAGGVSLASPAAAERLKGEGWTIVGDTPASEKPAAKKAPAKKLAAKKAPAAEVEAEQVSEQTDKDED